ncbi:hypothetical protein [Haloarcula sp. CGMCC 1.2071]|uniref:hypothetical protein n=1 Tax=Haloarcula sp. CGMCC 1.2071 TaxID=3111454 RepID=UPI00300EB577
MTGAAVATIATAGAATGGAAGAATWEGSINWASEYVDDPYINGSVTVETHEQDHAELDYVNDSGETVSLTDHGIVLASAPDSESAHNPVSLAAKDIRSPEFTAFPRGLQWDSDSDGDIDSEDDEVSALDATHWSTTGATNGSISVTDGDSDSLVIETSSVASGETVSASIDLSSVASEDATITDGIARKYLQTVMDVDSLPSGSTVEFAIIASDGTEVTAHVSPDADTSTVAGLADATGTSLVREARTGELESAQGVDLPDIQSVEVRVKEDSAGITLHGLNVERESEWEFGVEEYVDSDSNIDTREVTEPSGSFAITSLDSLEAPFDSAVIDGVSYDVEMRASMLPEEQVHARVTDAPSTYDRGKVLEVVPEFEWPTAYALSTVSAENMEDEVSVASSRYLTVEVATAVSDIDPSDDNSTVWEQVDNISWTDRSGSMGSVGSTTELLSSVAASDRSVTHIETNLSESEVEAATSTGSGAAVAASGGSGGFGGLMTLVTGLLGGLAVWKRKAIGALLGGN